MAITPPPPIGAQVAVGGAEEPGALSGQIVGVVGAPQGAPVTRSVGIGGGGGLTLQTGRSFAVRMHYISAPAGSTPGGVGRIAGRWNLGDATRPISSTAASEHSAPGLAAGMTVEVGVGLGTYGIPRGCSGFICPPFLATYGQVDASVHLVVSTFGVAEWFFGLDPAIGTMDVAGNTVAATYIGGDTGFRIRFPGRVSLAFAVSYHEGGPLAIATAINAQVLQASLSLQWTTPRFWAPRATPSVPVAPPRKNRDRRCPSNRPRVPGQHRPRKTRRHCQPSDRASALAKSTRAARSRSR